MKTNWLAAFTATLGFTVAGTVFAQQDSFSLSDSKPTTTQVSYVTRTTLSDEEAAAAEAEDAVEAPNPAPTQSCCDAGCDSRLSLDFLGNNFLGKGDCMGEPWTLFNNDNPNGIMIGGHTQIGYHAAGVNNAGTELFNTYGDRVQLNQQWLYVAKVAESDGKGPAWGFRMDYLYGTDGPDCHYYSLKNISF